MAQQTTNRVVMVPPDNFHFNIQTANTNAFQHFVPLPMNKYNKAMNEFEQMVAILRMNDIEVLILPSRSEVDTPDAVFPNNWFSTHQEGTVNTLILYPMLTENRRAERQPEKLQALLYSQGITINNIIDLTHFEKNNYALEGTGSMVFDRKNKLAFIALSPRSHQNVFTECINALDYNPIAFNSYDKNGIPIYHTNVMLSVGSHFAVIVSESITNDHEREQVEWALTQAGKEILTITLTQMEQMAANIIELRTHDHKSKIIMSQTAYDAFTLRQREQLCQYGDLLPVNIATIETLGGGSARCMLAEIFY